MHGHVTFCLDLDPPLATQMLNRAKTLFDQDTSAFVKDATLFPGSVENDFAVKFIDQIKLQFDDASLNARADAYNNHVKRLLDQDPTLNIRTRTNYINDLQICYARYLVCTKLYNTSQIMRSLLVSSWRNNPSGSFIGWSTE
jgi:hypothetical protein